MYYAYVLKSIDYDYYYKGHCKEFNMRLQQYKSGMIESIRPYIPFKVVYTQVFETEQEGILRQKYSKSAAGRRFLKKVVRL